MGEIILELEPKSPEGASRDEEDLWGEKAQS